MVAGNDGPSDEIEVVGHIGRKIGVGRSAKDLLVGGLANAVDDEALIGAEPVEGGYRLDSVEDGKPRLFERGVLALGQGLSDGRVIAQMTEHRWQECLGFECRGQAGEDEVCVGHVVGNRLTNKVSRPP